jgi:hypothetical protein
MSHDTIMKLSPSVDRHHLCQFMYGYAKWLNFSTSAGADRIGAGSCGTELHAARNAPPA